MFARALALALLVAATAMAEVPVPALSARVTDLTGTLTGAQRDALEAKLAAFERAKGSQVAVLLVPTTQPETIEQFGIRVADAWKIGRGGTIDDGVILIVAKNDRALRIEVGYGLEGALPDAIAKRIVEETIVPRFRRGDLNGGISDGVDQILRVIEGEPLPAPSRGVGGGLPQDSLPFLLIGPLLVGGLVRMTMNRFMGATAAGATGAGVAWWIAGASAALGIGLLCFLIVLLAQSGAGRRGGWSSSGVGGFGGGGWSGGGGGFGGGGASGRW